MAENKKQVCSRCGSVFSGFPALSRRDNKTEICPDCGIREVLEDFIEFEKKARTNAC